MPKLLYTVPVSRRGVRATAEVYLSPLGLRSVSIRYEPHERGELTEQETEEVVKQVLAKQYHATPAETALEFLGVAALAGIGWWALVGLSTLKK